MPLLKRIRVMAAKAESTIGTAETLTASEGAFNAYDVMAQASIDVEPREAQGSFNYLSGVPGARAGSMSFKTDISWNGTTMPAWASVLWPACGWVETTQVYSPVSAAPGTGGVNTITLGCYINGVKKLLAGCMGNYKLVLESGKIAYIEWEFQGVWQPVTDATILAPTYPTDLPLRFANSTTTYAAVNLCVQSVTIDAGNEVILRECPDTVAGYESALIVNRKPTISINPEATLVATDDPYGDWLAATEAAFALQLVGPTDATLDVSAPKAQIVNAQEGDRNKLVVDDIEMSCNKNGATADQELQFTFTDKSP